MKEANVNTISDSTKLNESSRKVNSILIGGIKLIIGEALYYSKSLKILSSFKDFFFRFERR